MGTSALSLAATGVPVADATASAFEMAVGGADSVAIISGMVPTSDWVVDPVLI